MARAKVLEDVKKLQSQSNEIATNKLDRTEIAKTTFTCNAKPGFTIAYQNNYKSRDAYYINLEVSKTDGSNYGVGISEIPIGLPVSTNSQHVFEVAGKNTSNQWAGVGVALYVGNYITVAVVSENIKSIAISGSVVL